MTQMEKAYFEKRGQILVKNLKNRHFDAWYCDSKEDALAKVLELIPEALRKSYESHIHESDKDVDAIVKAADNIVKRK